MLDINKIKIVLFDFDDTLCIHPMHGSINTEPNVSSVLKYGADTWSHCSANIHMADFMSLLEDLNIRMGLISACNYYFTMHAKQVWVKNTYGYDLENFCTNSADNKIKVLDAISEIYGYSKDEIMIVDDYWLVSDTCADGGYVSWTPMQVVNYVEHLKNQD